jgi:adenylate cyclase
LLSVSSPNEIDRSHLISSQNLGEEIKRSLEDWVGALASQHPVVVAIEDLHWTDIATLQTLERLAAATDRIPLLLVATTRIVPSSTGWRFRLTALADFPHRVSEMELGPLRESEASQLAEVMLPLGGLDTETKAEIVRRAEGNPLYLEELLCFLMETGGLQRSTTWTLTMPSLPALPPALESLMMERIDRLPAEARHLVQIAAIIGRDFELSLLEAVVGDIQLQDNLTVLLRAEIITERQRYPAIKYSFKHGLLREAALDTINPQRRRQFYGTVAEALESLSASLLNERHEVLAQYYAASEEPTKALPHLEKAAELAEKLGANPHAIKLWHQIDKIAKRVNDDAWSGRAGERLHVLADRVIG